MRVIQVINHFGATFGGAERLATMLHRDLLDAGVDAHLLAIGACDAPDLAQAVSFGFDSARTPKALLRLSAELRARMTDDTVIHAHLFPTTLYVSSLRRTGRLHAPCSMTEHSTWNRRRGHAVLRGLDRMIYRGFDRIATISDQAQKALLDTYPALATRAETIRNGAELRFDTPPERDRGDRAPIILTVARLARAKNIDTALRALALLTDEPWHYVIAGDGERAAELKALAVDLGIAERVTFLGHVMDVTPNLLDADLFLLPSLWEGFGLAAVEAMNAALPVVASTAPGLCEVVTPAGNPVVDPNDVEGLAAAIRPLLGSPELRPKLGAAGFSHAQNYDRRAMNDAYRALWSDLLPSKAGA